MQRSELGEYLRTQERRAMISLPQGDALLLEFGAGAGLTSQFIDSNILALGAGGVAVVLILNGLSHAVGYVREARAARQV